jgi:hypothetical protein
MFPIVDRNSLNKQSYGKAVQGDRNNDQYLNSYEQKCCKTICYLLRGIYALNSPLSSAPFFAI